MSKVLSPVVIKIKYYLPTKTNALKNVANLLYISNKPETVKEYKEYSQKEMDFDIEPEKMLQNLKDAEKHLQYAAEREGSHGVFDVENREANLIELKEELKNSKSIVYRIIFSLREDEAIRINHADRESFEETVRKTMPVIAEKIGIQESNLRWAAAFHEKEGHPHVHILFWEKEPKRTKGTLSKHEFREIKKSFVRNVYQKERERLYLEKNYLRQILRSGGREEMLKARQDLNREKIFVVKNMGQKERIPPIMQAEQLQFLARELEKLASIMPGRGRIALKYMPEEVKIKAREIADYILEQPGYKQSVQRYIEIQKELASHYTSNPEKLEKAGDRAYSDIRDRVAQDVLKVAAKIRYAEFSKLMDVRTVLRAAWNSIERERTKAEAQAKIIQMEKEREKQKTKGEREKEYD